MRSNRILVIDDDRNVLEHYKKIFTRPKTLDSSTSLDQLLSMSQNQSKKTVDPEDCLQFELEFVDQGLDGVDAIRNSIETKCPFKVVFIDMRMPPGIDGRETAKRIRDIDPKIEIVIVTAYSDHDLQEVVDYIGYKDKLLYLKKPFDSAEIKQMATALSTKWDQNQLKDEFLANVSHELKTPLTAIIGYLQIIDDFQTSEEVTEFLHVIQDSAELLNQLAEDLISIVKLDSSEKNLSKTCFDAEELIQSAISMLKPSLKTKPITIESCKTDGIKIFADKPKIQQCLMNFISNSIKYSEQGTIRISCQNIDGGISLSVSDQGKGISENDLDGIFQRFERIEKNHHNIPGLGLGLSICDRIKNLHNGKITVKSQVDIGSTFTLWIPQKEEIA